MSQRLFCTFLLAAMTPSFDPGVASRINYD